MGGQLRISVAEAPHVGIWKLTANSGDLLQPTRIDHDGDARLDSPVEFGKRNVQTQDGDQPGWRVRGARLTRRPPSGGMNLQRADQATWGAMGAIGRRRIDPAELGVKGIDAFFIEALLQRNP